MGQWAAGTWYHNAVWITYWTRQRTRAGTRWVEEWIAEELVLKYPGLGLRHPDWHNLVPTWDVGCYDDMTYVARTTVTVPAEAPGIYDLSLGGCTSGTRYSDSQHFGFNGDFAVNFLGEMLVK